MKGKVSWSEWVYCGIGEDMKDDVINKGVGEYFDESTVYFVSTRQESGEVNQQDILERIKKELEQTDLFLWDTNFKKVIEFDKIGVMR